MVKMKVWTDLSRIEPKINRQKSFATGILTEQVVKDGNQFVPVKDWYTYESALIQSDFTNGQAIWGTPYARRLYYGSHFNFSKDKNPQAGSHWHERAKGQYLRQWQDTARNAYRRGLG